MHLKEANPVLHGFLLWKCAAYYSMVSKTYTNRTLVASGDELVPVVIEVAEAESTGGPLCLLYLSRECCDTKFYCQ